MFVQVDSYIDSLYRFDLTSLKSCLSKKSIDQDLSCDIHIADFLTNSITALKEIQYMFTDVVKSSNSTYPRILSGTMRFFANSCEFGDRIEYRARFPNTNFKTRPGSWCSADFSKVGYYLQVVSHIPIIFTKIITGGLFYYNQGVT